MCLHLILNAQKNKKLNIKMDGLQNLYLTVA